jgi:hypothetical protein
MSKKMMVGIALTCAAVSSFSATWNSLGTATTDVMIPYFDADTVTRSAGSVTVWVKYIYDTESNQADGIYSYASRTTYFCSTRKSQTLTTSSYDKMGGFLSTDSKARDPVDLAPDTIGELILKSVCSANFPNDKSGKYYSPSLKNDPKWEAATYFNYQRAKKADPAPQ